jgi:regulator of nonsense transcripts 1
MRRYNNNISRRNINTNINYKWFILFFICVFILILLYLFIQLIKDYQTDELIITNYNILPTFTLSKLISFTDLKEYYNQFYSLLNAEKNNILFNSRYSSFNINKEIEKNFSRYYKTLNKFTTKNTQLSDRMYNLLLNNTSKELFNFPSGKSWADDFDDEEEEDDVEIMNINDQMSKVEINIAAEKAIKLMNQNTNPKNPKNINSNITLIQGPPGTGKTTLSVNYIINLYNKVINKTKSTQNIKLLICASSNNAVDEILKRSLVKNPNLPIVRVYSQNATIPDELQNYSLKQKTINKLNETDNGKIIVNNYLNNLNNNITDWEIVKIFNTVGNNILKETSIIATTCTKVYDENLFNNLLFDIILMDEASQMIETESLIPITRGSSKLKLILIGDQKQLSPNLNSDIAKQYGLQTSLFERLIQLKHKYIMLNIQYRMYPFISQFSNINFYNNRLESSKTTYLIPNNNIDIPYLYDFWNSISKVTPVYYPNIYYKNKKYNYINNLKPILFIDHIPENESDNGIEKIDQYNSIYNVKEAIITLNIVNMLLSKGISGKNIGIITPYDAQNQYITIALNNQENISDERKQELTDIKVNSIDNFQGQEKDYIIFNMVRSNYIVNEKTSLGFISDPKRINVALTRAKYGLFITGNSDYLYKNDKIGILEKLITYYQNQGCIINIDDNENSRSNELRKELQYNIIF